MKSKRRTRCGKGYENKNVVMRRGRDSAFAFLYFSVIFGAAVYLIAAAVWKGFFSEVLPMPAFVLF